MTSSSTQFLPLIIFLILSLVFFQSCTSHRIFTFPMHHRYSDQLKSTHHNNNRKNNHKHGIHDHKQWPKKGTYEYYADLAARDRLLHRRKISEIEEPVTFSDGNNTQQIKALGFLHYTTVELGTPGVKFLVALDTGSDLFWVPCQCSRCATLDSTLYDYDFEFNIYNPRASSTSKKVSCSNSVCTHRNQCIGTFNHCPYVMSYVSAGTSTTGILVEDVLHLTTEDHHQELVEAYITFGCGQVQTGSFLDVAAPNGLFGLGMEKLSVPSILSREGFTADSFSMCFGRDGVGRISFGDKGSPDQKETPFNVNPLHPTYNITVTQIRVGTAISDLEFTALFDSGTSFTYLVEPAYSKFTANFDLQVKDKKIPADPRLPFEYCYEMRPGANTSLVPSMSIAMTEGSHFTVYDPIIVLPSHGEIVYCLAVIRSTELNIIGQNFMTGYRIVFDREKFVLGWQNADCYDIQVFSTTEGSSTVIPPAVAAQLDNRTVDVGENASHSSAASPTLSRQFCKTLTSAILFLFGYPILLA